jgi:methionyl-tRNA formyltransferase
MNIVFAATGGPLALESLAALAARHRIVAVIRPAPAPGPLWKRAARRVLQAVGARPSDSVGRWTRAAGGGIRTILTASRTDAHLAEALRGCAPDLLCIASFPWLFPDDILGIPAAGALNLHPSLLPRHRGPNPFFWTYYHDDREAGITAHVATARADAGPIVAQHRTALTRGLPVEQLYLTLAAAGAGVMTEAVDRMAAGRASGTPQDEALATRAPHVHPGSPMVDFASWGAERVWHFLAGLLPRFREPVRDEAGRLIRYRAVTGYETGAPRGKPGVATRAAHGWMLWCKDGGVALR